MKLQKELHFKRTIFYLLYRIEIETQKKCICEITQIHFFHFLKRDYSHSPNILQNPFLSFFAFGGGGVHPSQKLVSAVVIP